MTMTHSPRPHRPAPEQRPQRRLDVAGLALLLIGLTFGVLSYLAISDRGLSALLIVPSVVAATTGALHITKLEVPRR
ncbi:hypothetical protein GCM10009593_12900 [Microlunatus antarcticus]|uniref:Uncharacterized protein n=1 Tax=Microlunatus antarcticus TaxID=53388 RepID=A0A7W5JW88_9ACTN|nr:hypothetical protein [Microlunatus antarcticus]